MTMTTETKRHLRPTWAVLLAGLTLAFGCTKAGKSLVAVTIDMPDPAVVGLASVNITVTPSAGAAVEAPFMSSNWAQPNTFGVYLGADVHGTVSVTAQGFDAAMKPIATSMVPGSAVVTPGQTTAPVTLHLIPYMAPAGTGGVGGTAPGTGKMVNPGSGGVAPGTGGVSGGGGIVATGGVPATGGAAGGGTGNTVGSGGAAGHGSGGSGGGGGAAGKAGRAWQGASLASSNKLMDDYQSAVAVDSKGNIVALYVHGSGMAANYYDISKGTWGTESTVDASAMTNAASPNVAVDKNGNWLAVWQQASDAPQHGIWQSTSTDGVHWSAPAAITTSGQVYEPVLAMNQDGVAVVVWTDEVPPDGNYTLTGSVRVNGTWTTPHVLRASTDTEERYAAAAVNSAGSAIVTWEQDDDTAPYQISVWQAYFSGGAWSTANLVENYTGGDSYSANVATNNAGQEVLTWLEATGSTIQLWAQRWPATGMPEAAMMIAEATNIAWNTSPAVTLDDSGTATAAWAFEIKTKFNVYTSRATWGQPWAAPMAMETDDDATDDMANSDNFAWVTSPMLGHDTAGNVALVWRKRSGTRFDMWARNYDAGTSLWTAGTLLETMDNNTIYAPAMAMGPSGVAVASWFYGYEFDIWANVYR